MREGRLSLNQSAVLNDAAMFTGTGRPSVRRRARDSRPMVCQIGIWAAGSLLASTGLACAAAWYTGERVTTPPPSHVTIDTTATADSQRYVFGTVIWTI